MSFDWQQPVTIRPIGVVESVLKTFEQIPTYTEDVCLVLREELAETLNGIEHFSHLHVLYYQHQREAWKRRAHIPEGQDILTQPLIGEPSCTGIYTTRSPARPSATGSCIVEIMRRDKNRLYVRGLDAVDGTPILDIKIYIPKYDSFPNAVAPLHWCQKIPMQTTSRLLHWDTINVALTLGMRAGKRAMQELGATRGVGTTAVVHGGNFFGQGVEAVTGCSVLHGTLDFEEKPKSISDWYVCLSSGKKKVEIRIKDQILAGADEVLSLGDDALLESVVVSELAPRG
ncbi:MAG: tRNA (N6-threonylcarbamoyladenosine(37)-N6)-methyltransferase TrmO [Acidobacteriota bacterium]|nr:tRNA (N6-threonylcarbamoyladenosine(37)-N6)-methyltransferase TrmO [Acidobacteriota bacterium]